MFLGMMLVPHALGGGAARAGSMEPNAAMSEDRFRYSLLTPRQRWVVNTVMAHVRKFEKENPGATMVLNAANVSWMVKTLRVHPDEVWLVADQMRRLAAPPPVGKLASGHECASAPVSE